MGKLLSTFGSRHGNGEIRAVRPTADRQEDLEIPVTLLVDVQLFQTAVEIIPNIIPRVRRPVLVGVCPAVGQEDFASVSLDVGESVQDVGKLVSRNILRLVIAAIAGPVLFFCQQLTAAQRANDGVLP